MLPSGNDCAICLAENLGAISKLEKQDFKKKFITFNELFLSSNN
jgi:hypothetical protein